MDSMVDRCELAMCCLLSCRIFVHLCLCLFVIVEYAKHLVCLSPQLDTAQQPSLPLSALYARHPAQEPFPGLAPPVMRYQSVYASGLSEDELSRLNVCEWTRQVRGPAEAACEGEQREEGEEESDVCSICLSGYEAGASVVWLPCGHVHHAECIRVWLSLRNVCPECRSEALPAAGQQRLVEAESV